MNNAKEYKTWIGELVNKIDDEKILRRVFNLLVYLYIK